MSQKLWKLVGSGQGSCNNGKWDIFIGTWFSYKLDLSAVCNTDPVLNECRWILKKHFLTLFCWSCCSLVYHLSAGMWVLKRSGLRVWNVTMRYCCSAWSPVVLSQFLTELSTTHSNWHQMTGMASLCYLDKTVATAKIYPTGYLEWLWKEWPQWKQ